MFFQRQGIEYKGEWKNDYKHGRGIIKLKNGDVVIGLWQNDRLNGIARFCKFGKMNFETVVFKNDMMVN